VIDSAALQTVLGVLTGRTAGSGRRSSTRSTASS